MAAIFSCFQSCWASNLVLNGPRPQLCSIWKASCHDGIIHSSGKKCSEHPFPRGPPLCQEDIAAFSGGVI